MKKTEKIILMIAVAVVIVIGVGAGIVHGKNSEQHTPQPTPTEDVATPATTHPLPPLTEGVATPPVNPQYVPILVYHSFGPQVLKKEDKMQLHYLVTTGAFDSQMKYLADNHYTPITFNAYVDYLKNGTPIPNKSVVLTFDDGWKSQYQYALPILQKYHFTGTFFIISGYPGYGAYMTWDQVLGLDHAGMEIASHTVHHINLAKAKTLAQVISEVTDSKKTLEGKLGHPITTLAYPEYGQNAAAQKAVSDAGYIGARAGWAKFKNSATHIFELTSQEVVNNPNPFSTTRLPDTKTP